MKFRLKRGHGASKKDLGTFAKVYIDSLSESEIKELFKVNQFYDSESQQVTVNLSYKFGDDAKPNPKKSSKIAGANFVRKDPQAKPV